MTHSVTCVPREVAKKNAKASTCAHDVRALPRNSECAGAGISAKFALFDFQGQPYVSVIYGLVNLLSAGTTSKPSPLDIFLSSFSFNSVSMS